MQTKVCTKCKEEKTIDLFSPNKELKFGVRNECKACKNFKKKHGHYPDTAEKVISINTFEKEEISEIDNTVPDLEEVANFINYKLKYASQSHEEFLKEIGIL
jgi:hypothetical protein